MRWQYCGVTSTVPIPSALSMLASPRRRAAAALATLVLLGHALLLGLLPRSPGPGWRAQPPQTLQLRQIVRLAPGAVVVAAAPVVSQAPSRPVHRPAPPAAAAAAAAVQPAPRAAPTPAPTPAPAPAPTAEREATPEPAADPGGQSVPVYATRPPPPLKLQFEMRRGLVAGEAELDWNPLGDQYQLTLRGQAFGAPLIGWASQGGFDDAGLAPLRYVESRRGRELRAVNFQRDSARITFSGPSVEHPLVAGAQDRLSWMVQLAAVLAANPALAATDAQVSMWVVGTRGDAEVWTFTVQGRVTLALALPLGTVENTVHLKREPRRPYDTQVQVWLDPSRHFLPAQALLMVRATGEGMEFRLQQLSPR